MLEEQNDIATLIRAIRQRTGLTQEKLASRLGVTFPTVNRWEHGRVRPSPLAILRIRELIGSLGVGGANLLESIEPSGWSAEEQRRLPRYSQEIIFIDTWPVLERGTD